MRSRRSGADSCFARRCADIARKAERPLVTRFPIENRGGLAPEDFVRIAGSLATHGSIKHAVDWLAGHNPRLSPSGMVTQDEFSHDILVAYPSGLWLVYDTT
jgi:hypothetical protein